MDFSLFSEPTPETIKMERPVTPIDVSMFSVHIYHEL